jgi:hypothetical protein
VSAFPVARDEAWRTAYEEQATPALFMRLMPLARRCSQRLATSGRIGGELRARELIQDALSDTLLGRLRWDPARKTLEAHAVDTIRSRTRDECNQATRYLSVDVPKGYDDAPGAEEGWEEADEAEEEPSWSMGADGFEGDDSAERLQEERLAEQVFCELRELAHGDREVLQLLRAYEHGARTSAEVLAMISLPTSAYRNARLRLGRMAKRSKTSRPVPMHRKVTTP